jgi:hypothetical protein
VQVTLRDPPPFTFADVLDAIGRGASLHVRWDAQRAALFDGGAAVLLPWGWMWPLRRHRDSNLPGHRWLGACPAAC